MDDPGVPARNAALRKPPLATERDGLAQALARLKREVEQRAQGR